MLLLLWLLAKTSATSYGTYKFWNNFGQVFYDYSGSGYHSVNGLSLDSEISDVVSTDRGVYFASTGSGYVTLHSEIWTLPPSFFWDWQFAAWIYVTGGNDGTLLRRTCASGESMDIQWRVKKRHQLEFVTCNAICTTGLVEIFLNTRLELATGWIFLQGRVDFTSGDYTVTINLSETDTDQDDISGTSMYSITSTCTTTLGTSFQGFIYSIELSDLTGSLGNGATDTGSCGGTCNFGSDPTLCNCVTCITDPVVGCISTCSSSGFLSDCVSTSTCSGIQEVGGACVQCNFPSLSCELDGTDLTSLICDAACAVCTGPTADDCECSYVYALPGCTCPSHSSLVGSECVCESGFLMLSIDGVYVCAACVDPCTECTGSVNYCTTCSMGVSPVEGLCECPEHSIYTGDGTCSCIEGYFDQCEGSCLPDCVPCSENCLKCEGIYACTSCVSGFPDESGECLVCEPGEYLALTVTCEQCSAPCTTCSSYDVCTACGDYAELVNNDCHCVESYVLQGQDCVPTNTTVELTVTDNNEVLIEFSKSLDEMLTRQELELTIEDDPEFTWELTMINSALAKLTFVFKEDIRMNQILYVTFVRDSSGRRLNTFEQETVEVELNSFKLIEESAASEAVADSLGATTGAVFVGSFAAMDFTAIWSLLNALEVIRYIAMTNNPLSPGLYAMLGAVGHYNSMTNFFKLFIEDNGVRPSDAAYYFGYTTNAYLVNGGKFLSMLVIFLGVGVLLWILSCFGLGRFSWFQSVCNPFRFDIFTRFWMQAYLTLGVCAILQVLDVLFMQLDYHSVQGLISFGLAASTLLFFLCLPFMISALTIYNQSVIEETEESAFHKRWGALYGEFRLQNGLIVQQYYVVFLLRRLLLILSIMFLNETPRIQAAINLLLAVFVTSTQNALYVFKFKPFRTTLFQYLNCLNELIVVTVYTMAFGMLELDRKTREDVGYAGIILILLLIAVNLLIALFKSVQGLCQLIRKKRSVVSVADEEPKNLTIHSEDLSQKKFFRSKSDLAEYSVK